MSVPFERDDPVAVFDSGVGGLSVLQALLGHLPDERFVFVADEKHLPYGDKPQAFIAQRVLDLCAWAKNLPAKAMVIACNTATAAGATQARVQHPDWPIVGIEPAVKPASMLTKTGVVGILATSNTVASERFRTLVERFDPLARVLAVPCPGLVELIEECPMNPDKIRARLVPVLDQLIVEGADVIVLGCTHYPFVKNLIQAHVGQQVAVIETGLPVARQLHQRLMEHGLLQIARNEMALLDAERVKFFTTGDPVAFKAKLLALLGPQWTAVTVGLLNT
ncbi:MAG TPA: glutamate racemase [Limnobacter sp.]|nr:glutamate racemase [Limnobacter sp.]